MDNSRKPLRLLSLDGGGVRGLSEIIILKRIMRGINDELKEPQDLHPWQIFDMIGGTSTGGIIAIMLGRLHMSLEECDTAYLNLSERIFTPKRSKWNPVAKSRDFYLADGKFDAMTLENVMKETIEKKLSQRQGVPAAPTPQVAKAADTLFWEPDQACKVFVVTARQSDSENARLRSYKNPQAAEMLLDECTIWQACRATSAATTFFDPIKIGKYGQVFVDGAFSSNNPVDYVLQEAKQIWGAEKEAILISLGTGCAPGKALEGNILGIIEAMKHIVTESDRTADRFYHQQSQLVAKNLYFRFSVAQGLAEVQLAEYLAVGKIANATEAYLDKGETNDKLRSCITAFVRLIKGQSIGTGQRADAVHGPFGSNFAASSFALNSLSAYDPMLDRSNLITRKGEVVDGTLQWVLLHQEYNAFLKSNSEAFWISGGPGTGKTMLSIFLTKQIANLIPPFHGHLFYFFCDYQDWQHSSAVPILRGLLYQLCKQCPLALSKLSIYLDNGSSAQQQCTKFEGLWHIFEMLVLDDSLGMLYCIIDGLDECDEDSIRLLIKKFNSLFSCSQRGALPSFKLVMTSRKKPNAAGVVFPHLHLDLDMSAGGHIAGDIRMVVCNRVDNLARQRQWPIILRDEVVKTVTTGADGTFLWATLAIDDIESKLLTEVKATLDILPRGLYPLYARMLQQIDGSRQKIIAGMLMWVLGSERPLSLGEMGAVLLRITGLPTYGDTNRVVKEYIEACGSMLSIQNDTIRLVHRSLAEYLLRNESGFYQGNKIFAFTMTQIHTEIADFCFSYLQEGPLKGGPVPDDLSLYIRNPVPTNSLSRPHETGNDPHNTPILEEFPLLPYAALMWPKHARRSTAQDAKFLDLAAPLYVDVGLNRAWLVTYWVKQREPAPTSFSIAHLASYLGLRSLLEKLLAFENSQNIEAPMVPSNIRDSYGRTPLWYAASNGYLGITETLIENRAMVGIRDYTRLGDRDTPLLKAAKLDHGLVAQRLIEAGAYVRAKDKYGSTSLHEAAFYGNEALVRLLLDRGADINARDCGGRTPMMRVAGDSIRGDFMYFAPESTRDYPISRMAGKEKAKYQELKALVNHSLPAESSRLITFPSDSALLSNPICDSPISGQDIDHFYSRGAVVKAPPEQRKNFWIEQRTSGSLAELLGIDAAAADALSQDRTAVKKALFELVTQNAKAPEKYDDSQKAIVPGPTLVHRALNIKATALTLLDRRPELDALNVFGQTALHRAVMLDDCELVGLLIEAGADLEMRDARGRTPLYIAALFSSSTPKRLGIDRTAMFGKLLAAGANINAMDFWGSPCGYWELKRESKSISRILVENGLDINAPVAHNINMLTHSLFESDGQLAMFLINSGVDIHLNDKGRSPLTLAILAGLGPVASLLLEKNINPRVPDDNGDIPLVRSLHDPDVKITNGTGAQTMNTIATFTDARLLGKMLQYHPDLNGKGPEGLTTLQSAALCGSLEVNKVLLENGADADVKLDVNLKKTPYLSKGSSILHLAAHNQKKHGRGVLKLYLQRLRDVDPKDKYGRTPLHIVSEIGNVEGFDILATHGADLTCRDFKPGTTPLDCAKRAKNQLWKTFLARLILKEAEYVRQRPGLPESTRARVEGCSLGVLRNAVQQGILAYGITSPESDDEIYKLFGVTGKRLLGELVPDVPSQSSSPHDNPFSTKDDDPSPVTAKEERLNDQDWRFELTIDRSGVVKD